MTTERLQLLRFKSTHGENTFAEDVRRGLSASPKFLLPKYFYDALGSHLFEAICHLPEYYLTRAESEILRARSDTISSLFEGPHALVELGSGSSSKTRLLIETLLEQQASLHYLPIDISETALERSARQLLQSYPALRITALAADYETALDAVAGDAASLDRSERILFTFLGSSIGNLGPAGARTLIGRIRRILKPGDSLLLGADLKKSTDILIPAYNDALGVTAAFALNLLLRINRELGGKFPLKKFSYRAVYNEQHGRIELYVVSRERQSVQIEALDLTVELDRDEPIHVENSYKYDLEQLRSLARDTGFEPTHNWFDSERLFSLNLFRA